MTRRRTWIHFLLVSKHIIGFRTTVVVGFSSLGVSYRIIVKLSKNHEGSLRVDVMGHHRRHRGLLECCVGVVGVVIVVVGTGLSDGSCRTTTLVAIHTSHKI